MPVSAIRQHTLRAYCHVPHGPFDMSARIEAQIERFRNNGETLGMKNASGKFRNGEVMDS